jgi:hypothetical protein
VVELATAEGLNGADGTDAGVVVVGLVVVVTPAIVNAAVEAEYAPVPTPFTAATLNT